MCSVMTLKTKPGDLTQVFKRLYDPEGIDAVGVDIRAHGYLKREVVPVIYNDTQSGITLRNKYFSLCPDWAKTWPFEYETYNARLTRPRRLKNPQSGYLALQHANAGKTEIETIAEVPSFRHSFSKGQTCLVPLSGAVESCYFGKSAGQIVRFEEVSSGLLFAAGLWNDWLDPKTGEFIPTFTLLTDHPDPVIYSHGHDRSLIAINQNLFIDWLAKKMDAQSRLDFLRSARIQPRWNVVTERELKKGWSRRAPSETEIEQIEVWRSEKLG